MSKLKAAMDAADKALAAAADPARGNTPLTKRAMLGRFSGHNRAERRAEEFERQVAGGQVTPSRTGPGRQHRTTGRKRARRAAQRAKRKEACR